MKVQRIPPFDALSAIRSIFKSAIKSIFKVERHCIKILGTIVFETEFCWKVVFTPVQSGRFFSGSDTGGREQLGRGRMALYAKFIVCLRKIERHILESKLTGSVNRGIVYLIISSIQV